MKNKKTKGGSDSRNPAKSRPAHELPGGGAGAAGSLSAPVETAKVTLVTIVAAGELLDGLKEYLSAAGTSGYTVSRADGRGLHGPRKAGFLDIGNVRIETLLPSAAAQTLLGMLAREYADRDVIAFSHNVEAIPRTHCPLTHARWDAFSPDPQSPSARAPARPAAANLPRHGDERIHFLWTCSE